jgi:hypothetical protein
MRDESMTPELVERARALLDAGNRGDWDTAMGFFAPDAVWVAVDALETFEGTAIRDFWVDWYAAYESVRIEILEIASLGGGVVMVVIRQSGRFGNGPSRLREDVVLVYEWSNGLVERVTSYVDIDEGRAAAERLAQEREQPMSSGNVALVRSFHPPPSSDLSQIYRDDARWAKASAMLAPFLAPDFKCLAHGYLEADGETFKGLAGLRYLWLEWLTPWASYRAEVEEMVDLGDQVLVLVRDCGTRAGDDHEVAVSSAAIWTLREGKVAEIAFHVDRSTAFKAVGLEG